MSDGTRTHDRLDHNQELYQLSYAHRGMDESTSARGFTRTPPRPPRPEPSVSVAAVAGVGAVIEVERVTDASPQTGEAPVLARTPQHDQGGTENDEPDHIV